MAHPKSIALSELVGDAEVKAFASDIERPLVIVGNGPSAAPPPYELLPSDPVVLRMNWFFLEDHYYFGRQVDAWLYAIVNEELERRIRDVARNRDYDFRFLCAPAKPPALRHDEEWYSQLYDLGARHLDHWAVIARNPRLARMCMSRPLPTTGMQAIAFGLGMGFREIYLCGIDLYESDEARYGWHVPDDVRETLLPKDLVPGYEDRHTLDNDLRFLSACLAEYPDASIWNLGDSTNLNRLLSRPEPAPEGSRFLDGTTPQLCEPRGRLALGDDGELSLLEPVESAALWAERDGKRVAYVTLVSGGFHHGARALANSLKRVSEIPLIAMCTPDADRSALAASGIHCVEVAEITNPNPLSAISKRFAPTYSKLNVFRLSFLDRFVYLDADTVVFQNIDDLFDTAGFAAVPDAGIDRPSGTFNSGVLVCEPSSEVFDAMLEQLPRIESYDGGDQGFLNGFFADWTELPAEYNVTKRIAREHPNLSAEQDVKVLHYVGVKPWQPESHPNPYSEDDWRWLDFLARDELRELVVDLRDEAMPSSRFAVAKRLTRQVVRWLRRHVLHGGYRRLLRWADVK